MVYGTAFHAAQMKAAASTTRLAAATSRASVTWTESTGPPVFQDQGHPPFPEPTLDDAIFRTALRDMARTKSAKQYVSDGQDARLGVPVSTSEVFQECLLALGLPSYAASLLNAAKAAKFTFDPKGSTEKKQVHPTADRGGLLKGEKKSQWKPADWDAAERRLFRCSVCQHTLASASAVEQHILSHGMATPPSCVGATVLANHEEGNGKKRKMDKKTDSAGDGGGGADSSGSSDDGVVAEAAVFRDIYGGRGLGRGKGRGGRGRSRGRSVPARGGDGAPA